MSSECDRCPSSFGETQCGEPTQSDDTGDKSVDVCDGNPRGCIQCAAGADQPQHDYDRRDDIEQKPRG